MKPYLTIFAILLLSNQISADENLADIEWTEEQVQNVAQEPQTVRCARCPSSYYRHSRFNYHEQRYFDAYWPGRRQDAFVDYFRY